MGLHVARGGYASICGPDARAPGYGLNGEAVGSTLTEKIMSRAAGYPVHPGDLAVVNVDFAMVQDINGPRVVDVLDELGAEAVFDPASVMFVFDHYSPEPTPQAADFHAKMQRAARRYHIPVRGIGSGICHQLVMESRRALPGTIIVGTDSHSSTYGGVGSMGISLGATEMAIALVSGRAWFKVPEPVRVTLKGTLASGATGKDVALELIRVVGEEGGLYKCFEFQGEGVLSLSIPDRLTICNMVVDCGAKAGLFPADRRTAEWLAGLGAAMDPPGEWQADEDASYREEIEIDLSTVAPLVARPGSVDDVVPVSQVLGTPVSLVFIGTCTNGRIEDYREVCRVLKGRQVAIGLRLLCYPASRSVQQAMLEEGLVQVLVDAGAVVMPPGCGPCAGLHGGVAGAEDVVFSTSSRNYTGRMGANSALIYLGSPVIAAATAVAGMITTPDRLPGDAR